MLGFGEAELEVSPNLAMRYPLNLIWDYNVPPPYLRTILGDSGRR